MLCQTELPPPFGSERDSNPRPPGIGAARPDRTVLSDASNRRINHDCYRCEAFFYFHRINGGAPEQRSPLNILIASETTTPCSPVPRNFYWDATPSQEYRHPSSLNWLLHDIGPVGRLRLSKMDPPTSRAYRPPLSRV